MPQTQNIEDNAMQQIEKVFAYLNNKGYKENLLMSDSTTPMRFRDKISGHSFDIPVYNFLFFIGSEFRAGRGKEKADIWYSLPIFTCYIDSLHSDFVEMKKKYEQSHASINAAFCINTQTEQKTNPKNVFTLEFFEISQVKISEFGSITQNISTVSFMAKKVVISSQWNLKSGKKAFEVEINYHK